MVICSVSTRMRSRSKVYLCFCSSIFGLLSLMMLLGERLGRVLARPERRDRPAPRPPPAVRRWVAGPARRPRAGFRGTAGPGPPARPHAGPPRGKRCHLRANTETGWFSGAAWDLLDEHIQHFTLTPPGSGTTARPRSRRPRG